MYKAEKGQFWKTISSSEVYENFVNFSGRGLGESPF